MDQNHKGIDFGGAFKSSDGGKELRGAYGESQFYPGTPKIVRWVIMHSGGSIKSEKQANILLLGFVVLVIIVSFVLFFGNRTVTLEPAPPDVLPEEF